MSLLNWPEPNDTCEPIDCSIISVYTSYLHCLGWFRCTRILLYVSSFHVQLSGCLNYYVPARIREKSKPALLRSFFNWMSDCRMNWTINNALFRVSRGGVASSVKLACNFIASTRIMCQSSSSEAFFIACFSEKNSNIPSAQWITVRGQCAPIQLYTHVNQRRFLLAQRITRTQWFIFQIQMDKCWMYCSLLRHFYLFVPLLYRSVLKRRTCTACGLRARFNIYVFYFLKKLQRIPHIAFYHMTGARQIHIKYRNLFWKQKEEKTEQCGNSTCTKTIWWLVNRFLYTLHISILDLSLSSGSNLKSPIALIWLKNLSFTARVRWKWNRQTFRYQINPLHPSCEQGIHKKRTYNYTDWLAFWCITVFLVHLSLTFYSAGVKFSMIQFHPFIFS